MSSPWNAPRQIPPRLRQLAGEHRARPRRRVGRAARSPRSRPGRTAAARAPRPRSSSLRPSRRAQRSASGSRTYSGLGAPASRSAPRDGAPRDVQWGVVRRDRGAGEQLAVADRAVAGQRPRPAGSRPASASGRCACGSMPAPAENTSPRRASMQATSTPSPASSASSVRDAATGTPSANPSPRAVARPMRRPVNVPGPLQPRSHSRRPRVSCGAPSRWWTSASSRWAPGAAPRHDSASTSPSRVRQAVATSVAVSRESSSKRVQQAGSTQTSVISLASPGYRTRCAPITRGSAAGPRPRPAIPRSDGASKYGSRSAHSSSVTPVSGRDRDGRFHLPADVAVADRVRGAGHRPGHAQRRGRRAHERGLAGAQLTAQPDRVAAAQQRRQRSRQRLGLGQLVRVPAVPARGVHARHPTRGRSAPDLSIVRTSAACPR